MAQPPGTPIDPTSVSALIVSGVIGSNNVYNAGVINTAVPGPVPLNYADGLILLSGTPTAPAVINFGSQGLAFETRAELLDATLPSSFVISPNGDAGTGGAAGSAGASQHGVRTTTAIISDGATAKTILTILIPNAAQSCVMLLTLRIGITTTGHIYDSTRAGLFLLAITRVPGAATVATLTSLSNATIATSAAGQTATYALSLPAVSGAVGATQTLLVQATVTGSVAGTADCQVDVTTLNASATGITVS